MKGDRMRQGRADRSGAASHKREPIARAINPGGADALGQSFAGEVTPLRAGRGYMPPEPRSHTIHKAGSQGKHR